MAADLAGTGAPHADIIYLCFKILFLRMRIVFYNESNGHRPPENDVEK